MKAEAQLAWSTPSSSADLKTAIDEIKKNAKQILEFAKSQITSYQKQLDKLAIAAEEYMKSKGFIGEFANAIAARPIINFLKSLVYLNPDQVAEQLSENPIFNIYDLLDNANIIPEGSPYLQTISNFYDWVQVYNDIKPFILKKETDPYHYIEAATDLIFALKESTIAGQIPSLDVLNTSLMSAYIFYKAGAPTATYLKDTHIRKPLKVTRKMIDFAFPYTLNEIVKMKSMFKPMREINKATKNILRRLHRILRSTISK
jgi:hypothetical protein